jgi:amino acid transporter
MATRDNSAGGRASTGATAAGSTSAGSQRASGDTRSNERVDTARETQARGYQPQRRDDSEARDRFGGINWGAGFFGWLVAIGMTIILSGIVAAVVSAIGSQVDMTLRDARTSAGSIGIGAGITLLVVLMLAYFTGGYVAGRMSRFDGARQGFATWLIGLVVTILVALIGAVAGTQYNIFDRISLPRLPLDLRDLGIGGIITAAAVLVGTLLAAVVGGKVGHRYHDKVDKAAGITA